MISTCRWWKRKKWRIMKPITIQLQQFFCSFLPLSSPLRISYLFSQLSKNLSGFTPKYPRFSISSVEGIRSRWIANLISFFWKRYHFCYITSCFKYDSAALSRIIMWLIVFYVISIEHFTLVKLFWFGWCCVMIIGSWLLCKDQSFDFEVRFDSGYWKDWNFLRLCWKSWCLGGKRPSL